MIRKALYDIKKDYEEIVDDIEGDTTVSWPSSTLGKPVFESKRFKGKLQNKNNLVAEAIEDQDVCCASEHKPSIEEPSAASEPINAVLSAVEDSTCCNSVTTTSAEKRLHMEEKIIHDTVPIDSGFRINPNQSVDPSIQLSVFNYQDLSGHKNGSDKDVRLVGCYFSKEVQTTGAEEMINENDAHSNRPTDDNDYFITSSERVKDNSCQTTLPLVIDINFPRQTNTENEIRFDDEHDNYLSDNRLTVEKKLVDTGVVKSPSFSMAETRNGENSLVENLVNSNSKGSQHSTDSENRQKIITSKTTECDSSKPVQSRKGKLKKNVIVDIM